jgi:hypothetical protein
MAGIRLALTLALGATGLLAQARPAAFDAKRVAVPRDLDDAWLVHSSDNPSYANPSFNDSNWTAFNLHTLSRRPFTEPIRKSSGTGYASRSIQPKPASPCAKRCSPARLRSMSTENAS